MEWMIWDEIDAKTENEKRGKAIQYREYSKLCNICHQHQVGRLSMASHFHLLRQQRQAHSLDPSHLILPLTLTRCNRCRRRHDHLLTPLEHSRVPQIVPQRPRRHPRRARRIHRPRTPTTRIRVEITTTAAASVATHDDRLDGHDVREVELFEHGFEVTHESVPADPTATPILPVWSI